MSRQYGHSFDYILQPSPQENIFPHMERHVTTKLDIERNKLNQALDPSTEAILTNLLEGTL